MAASSLGRLGCRGPSAERKPVWASEGWASQKQSGGMWAGTGRLLIAEALLNFPLQALLLGVLNSLFNCRCQADGPLVPWIPPVSCTLLSHPLSE